MVSSKTMPFVSKSRNSFLKLLGPGIITGAADDDPSGIATYSQVGLNFAAGSVMNEPRSGPTVSIESHQAAGVF